MRRRTLLVALAGVVVSFATGAFLLWPRSQPSRVTQENFARIHEGMSRADVEAILGPAGDYRTGPTALVVPRHIDKLTPAQAAHETGAPDLGFGLLDDCTFASWQCDDRVIWICYYKDGVSMFDVAPVGRVPGGPVADFVWRIERQWRRWFP